MNKTLSNQEALDLLLKSYQQLNNNDISAILDTKFKILDANKNSFKLYNGAVIGKYFIDDFASNDELIAKNHSILKRVAENKVAIDIISVNFRRERKYFLCLFRYVPVINTDTDDLIAIKVEATEPRYSFSWNNLSKIIKPRQAKTYSIITDELLDQTEHEILFLLFNCDSYEAIADIMCLTHGKKFTAAGIGQIIRRKLFEKFEVYNLIALKEKAHNLGYHKKIPVTLLDEIILELDNL